MKKIIIGLDWDDEDGRYAELDKALEDIPTIGYRDAKGRLVLPADWDDPADAVYDNY